MIEGSCGFSRRLSPATACYKWFEHRFLTRFVIVFGSQQPWVKNEWLYRDHGDPRRVLVSVVDQDVDVGGLIDRDDGRGNAEEGCRARGVPLITSLLGPNFLAPPIGR